MVKVGESGPKCLVSWKAHQFEAWITALGHQSHLVFTGGDDSRLCVWDTRTGCKKPCFVSRRLVCGKCTQACRFEFLNLQSSLLTLLFIFGFVDTRWECAVCKLIHQRVISLHLEGESLNTCVLSILFIQQEQMYKKCFYFIYTLPFFVSLCNPVFN